MNEKVWFYQEPQKTSPKTLLIYYAMVLAFLILWAYAYTVITVLVPIPYVLVFITVIFARVLGMYYRLGHRVSHLTGKKNRLLHTAIAGVLANYFQWTAFLTYVSLRRLPSLGEYLEHLVWVADPEVFFKALMELNEHGSWSLFGAQFTGTMLSIIWIFEALIILLFPLVSVARVQPYPYSELFKKWYPKYVLFKDFEPIIGEGLILEELKKGPLECLNNLDKGSANRHSKIYIYYLENESKQYLSITRLSKDSNGGEKASKVLNNFTIDTETAQAILQDFNNKKEKIDII